MMNKNKLSHYSSVISLKSSDEVEFFGPEIENFTCKIETIWDEKGNELDAARHPLQIVKFKLDQKVYPSNMMRKGK